MYACVDQVTDRIKRKLRRFKERKVAETRGRAGLGGLSEKVWTMIFVFLVSRLCFVQLGLWFVLG